MSRYTLVPSALIGAMLLATPQVMAQGLMEGLRLCPESLRSAPPRLARQPEKRSQSTPRTAISFSMRPCARARYSRAPP
jgi:hypothetical protein